MVRTSLHQIAERLAFTSQAMTRLRATHLVLREVSQHFGVNERTVVGWMRKVREQRRAEASDVDREVARDQLRADYNAVVSMALNRTEVVKDKDGGPMLDSSGRPMVRAKPDLGHALQALRELANLDGLPEPVKHEHKVEAKVDAAPDLGGLTSEQLAAGMAFVTSLAPDGDMAKLLGEHFKLAGTRPTLPPEATAPSSE